MRILFASAGKEASKEMDGPLFLFCFILSTYLFQLVSLVTVGVVSQT